MRNERRPPPLSDRLTLPAVVAIAGLAASAVALADTLAGTPAFCAASGCETVRSTGWATPLGVPLPVIGLAFFACALTSAFAGARLRLAVALAGGAGGVALIAIQGVAIGAWCPVCLVADLAAVAHAVAVLAVARGAPPSRTRVMVFAAAAAIAVAAPLALAPATSTSTPAPTRPTIAGLPEVIAREQRPGEVVLVDFVDFECPFCRRLHARLVEAIDRAGIPVRVVRKMVPLPMHRGALPAALAYCAAARQGRADAMAEALLAAPTSQLTPAGCERLAASVGVDLDRYRADVRSPDILAEVEADLADAEAAGVRSLPTVYINDRAFVGAAATVDDLVAALESAARS